MDSTAQLSVVVGEVQVHHLDYWPFSCRSWRAVLSFKPKYDSPNDIVDVCSLLPDVLVGFLCSR